MSKRARRKGELTDIAARMIATKGDEGVRIADIAEAAGVSKGSVFYYFPDREELMLETYRRAVDEFHERRLETLGEIANPVERLATAVMMWVPDTDDDPGWRVMLELCVKALRSTPHRVLIKHLYDRSEALYTAIIEEGERSGELTLRSPARTIARTLCGLEDISGIYLSVGCFFDPGNMINAIADYFELATGCRLPLSEARP